MNTDRENKPTVKDKIMLSSSMFSTPAYDSLKISAIQLALKIANGSAKRGDIYWCDFQPSGYWLNAPSCVALADKDLHSNIPNQGTLNTLYSLAGYALCSDIIAL